MLNVREVINAVRRGIGEAQVTGTGEWTTGMSTGTKNKELPVLVQVNLEIYLHR